MAREIWGDFEVDLNNRIGVGGMGTVYRARQISLSRSVAIKILTHELCKDPGYVQQFESEAQLVGRLQHENVVGVFGAGRSATQRPFIAFELVEGQDLRAHLAKMLPPEARSEDNDRAMGLPVKEVVGYSLQVASALSVAHAAGIVHRDLKPSNILMTPVSRSRRVTAGLGVRLTGQHLKVSDFGIACMTEDHATRLLDLGSPLYMAPEQLDGQIGDARVDLYSLGVIMFEMLVGRPPFVGTLAEIMGGHVLGEIRWPGKADPQLGPLIERLLRKDPKERFSNAESIVKALRALGLTMESRLSSREMLAPRAELEDQAEDPLDDEHDSALLASSDDAKGETAELPGLKKTELEDEPEPDADPDADPGGETAELPALKKDQLDDSRVQPPSAVLPNKLDETRLGSEPEAPEAPRDPEATSLLESPRSPRESPGDVSSHETIAFESSSERPAKTPVKTGDTFLTLSSGLHKNGGSGSTVGAGSTQAASLAATEIVPHRGISSKMDTSYIRRSRSRSTTVLPGPEALRVRCGADHELFPEYELGQGGMGLVYLGRQVSLDRAVAIKVLKGEGGEDIETARERFDRESRLAAKIQHPNVVNVLAAGVIESPEPEFENAPYYAMELIYGEDLKEHLSKGREFQLNDTLTIMEQSAAGLWAAAEFDLVHRDIKPGNLILTETAGEMRIKIADFGLAKDLNAHSMTQRGTVLGSIAYMAPEQVGGKVDQRADIYSLGVTWFHILTGHLPFQEPTISAMLKAHRERPAPSVPGLPEDVSAALARCLEKKPSKRFQSALELLEEIRRLKMIHGDSEAFSMSARQSARYSARVPVVLEDTQVIERPNVWRRQGVYGVLTWLVASVVITSLLYGVRHRQYEEWTEAVSNDLARQDVDSCQWPLSRLLRRHPGDEKLEAFERWREVIMEMKDFERRLPARISRQFAKDNKPALEALRSQIVGTIQDLELQLPAESLEALYVLSSDLESLAERLLRPLRGPEIPAGMKLVKGGEFFLGTQKVRVRSFALDVHEVNNEDYQEFLKAVESQGHKWCHDSVRGKNIEHSPRCFSLKSFGGAKNPVVGVSWYDAYAYARFRGKRLPTEAEWERAVSEPNKPFPWGVEFRAENLRWAGGPSDAAPESTTFVCGAVPMDCGPYGHYDLLGNVREWCGDWFQARTGEVVNTAVVNPRGPDFGKARVIRGFSWAFGTQESIIAFARGRARPETRALDLGFRCAFSLNEEGRGDE